MFEDLQARNRAKTIARLAPYLLPDENVDEAVLGDGGVPLVAGVFIGIAMYGVVDFASLQQTGNAPSILWMVLFELVGFVAIYPFSRPVIIAATTHRLLLVRVDLRSRPKGVFLETPRADAALTINGGGILLGQLRVAILVPGRPAVRAYVPRALRTRIARIAGSEN